MRNYGFNKATEFTPRQIGVIYRKAKIGELRVEKWFMEYLYDLAEFYGIDYNGSVELEEMFVLGILEQVFENNNEEAQELINEMQDNVYSLFGMKRQKSTDRSVCVA